MSAKQPDAIGRTHIDDADAFARAFNVSRETVAKLEVYAAILQEWQKAINLVSPTTIDDLWHRHFADSAQLYGYTTDSKTLLDLGSGAGFPGLLLAIMSGDCKGRKFYLIESNGKKCAFLRHVARETGVPVDIIEARIETLHNSPTLGEVDCITARALAPLGKLLGYSAPLFADKTKALFLKGRETARELEEAAQNWSFRSELHPSRTDKEGQIVEIRELKPVC